MWYIQRCLCSENWRSALEWQVEEFHHNPWNRMTDSNTHTHNLHTSMAHTEEIDLKRFHFKAITNSWHVTNALLYFNTSSSWRNFVTPEKMIVHNIGLNAATEITLNRMNRGSETEQYCSLLHSADIKPCQRRHEQLDHLLPCVSASSLCFSPDVPTWHCRDQTGQCSSAQNTTVEQQ